MNMNFFIGEYKSQMQHSKLKISVAKYKNANVISGRHITALRLLELLTPIGTFHA